MSYIKACNKCGARISIRQMAQGQWVAFDVSSDEPHECGVAGRKSPRTIVKKKKASNVASINQTLDDMHIVDRLGEIHELKFIPEEWLDLTPLNLKKLFNVLIAQKRKAQIQYEDRNGDITSRVLYPVSLIQGYAGKQSKSKTLKVVGYCKLREDYRTFLLDSIDEIQAQNKIPKSFLDKFNSLSQQERNEIIEGSNFYGSNTRMVGSGEVFDAQPNPNIDIVKNRSENKPKPKPTDKPKTKPIPKKVIKPEVNINYGSTDDDNGLGTFFKSIIWIIIFFSALLFLGA
jgi:hypothetical protein